MGAWGTKPFENDDAGDWSDAIRIKITDAFDPGTSRFDETRYAKARAAAEAMIATNEIFKWNADEIRLAIERIEAIATDKFWIGKWRSPRAIRAAVMKQRSALFDMLTRRVRNDRRRR